MPTTTVTQPRARRAFGLLASLSPLLLLALLFWPPAPALATNNVVVGDGVNPASCNMISLAAAMNGNTDANITFSCGGPATITVTQVPGLNVDFAQHFTITGGDVITLTGIDASRLFWVHAGASLTLTHIALTHGFNSFGGGAVLNDGGYLALDHVTASHNRATVLGGAIEDAGGTTRLTNSILVDNTAGDGGALRSAGALTLANTTLISNAASDTGGAMLILGPALISAGQVLSNAAGTAGGALYLAATSQATVDGVLFAYNHTQTSTVSPLYAGGAIKSGGALTVTRSTFSANAAIYGGAIYHDGGSASLTDDTLSGNTAQYGGGLSNSGSSSYTNLYHTLLQHNTGGVLGGGLYGEKGLVSLRQQSDLNDNTAQAGGGFYAKAGSNFLLVDSSLENNHATNENGGGLYIEKGSVGGTSNVTFKNNHAEGAGGAIDNEADGFSVSGSLLTGNTAPYGAGLYSTGVNVLVGVSTFEGNRASFGGALDNEAGGSVYIYGTTLAANTAFFGGGVNNAAGGTIQLAQSTLAANSAQSGGGVQNEISATLSLENSTLSGNSASTVGGGLENSGLLTLTNATVSNNRAVTGGGLNIEIGAHAVLTNTLLAYSADGGNCVGPIAAARYSASSDNTCGFVDLINGHHPNLLDPLLTALGHYGGLTAVHMLKHNSPVLDGVGGSQAPTLDQRGFPRPKGLGFDLGAVERQPGDSDLAPWLFLPLIRH